MLAKFQRQSDGSEVVYDVPDRWRGYPPHRMALEGTLIGVLWLGSKRWRICWGKKWQLADSSDKAMLAAAPMRGALEA
jgi:hypothetical protein